MTNKEAIKELEELRESTWKYLVRPIEALDLAIKALETIDAHSDIILNEEESNRLLNLLEAGNEIDN